MSVTLHPTLVEMPNYELLHQELVAALATTTEQIAVGKNSQGYYVIAPDGTTLLQVQGICDAHDPALLTAEQKVAAARGNIQTLAAKAKNHADRIALCFDAVVSGEEAGDDAAAFFARITTALNDPLINDGFRTLTMTAFTAKSGLSFDFGNLAAVVLATKQAFNAFAADFFTRWALMVTLA